MAKLTPEQIDAIPGLRAALNNDNVVFLNLDTDDTNPTLTAGFTDEDIKRMDLAALQKMESDAVAEEARLISLLTDVRKRTRDARALVQRKQEISDGVHNRPG